jgi:hypothetical protein
MVCWDEVEILRSPAGCRRCSAASRQAIIEAPNESLDAGGRLPTSIVLMSGIRLCLKNYLDISRHVNVDDFEGERV